MIPTATYNGKNSIDVAVSNSGDPTGAWTIYHVPAQNDGTDGTPNHGCTTDGTTPGPCFQDYPHIGADKYGVYITTNEYDLFGPNFNAAQIFAFSKAQLAAHPASINVTLVENLNVDGSPGFTVWPATSPAGQYSSERNGTEYFLSTIAGDGSETGNPTGTARRIGLWAVTNTKSLDSGFTSTRMDQPANQQRDVRVPAQGRPKAGQHPAGRLHQQHHDAHAIRPRLLADPLRPPARRTTRSRFTLIQTTHACNKPGTSTACCGERQTRPSGSTAS